jgi:formylglycine-generating enzyme required for sulfatase activity
MLYSGASKVDFCRRLGDDWRFLADHLEIPDYEQRGFEHGEEAHHLWKWLAQRARLSALPAALAAIGRQDLVETLEERQRYDARRYYQSRIDQWSKPRFELDKRFVQLTLWLDQGEDAQAPRWAAQPRKFQDLRAVLSAARDYPALVLLGPPGSGKSTLLRHVELDIAHEALDHDDLRLTTAPVTFFIELSLYKPLAKGEALPAPRDWLAQRWQESFGEHMPPLDTMLREGCYTVLLLDALNEMPHQGVEHIEAWRDFLALLAVERPNTRVIFSCRTQDYGAKLSTKTLPVPQVRIEALSEPQMRAFVEKYRPGQGGALWEELANNPQQLDLYRSPYYLKMLVDQAGPEAKVPRGRAALFTSFVRQALDREIVGDNPLLRPSRLLTDAECQQLAQNAFDGCDLPSEGPLFTALSALAYHMQETGARREDSQIRIPSTEALQALAGPRERHFPKGLNALRALIGRPPYSERAHAEQAEDILSVALALQVLEQDLPRQEVRFYHQLLQEYFAGRRLAERPDPGLVRTSWQANRATPPLKQVLASLPDSDPLPLLPSTGWEETTRLAAAMVNDADAFVAALMKVNLPLAGRCAAQPDVRISDDLRARLRQSLIARSGDPKADLRARIAAGLALGELGDPRFQRRSGVEAPYLWPPLVEIPGGSYSIGSEEGHYEDEAPVHTVTLNRFWTGQFPVTNAEWALFMEAQGYEDERWWATPEDQAWQRGERTAEGPKQDWRELRQQLQQGFERIRALQQQGRITSKQADDWEQIARMDDDAFEALLDDWYPTGRQTRPAFWNDEAFNNPAQPVVGVSWFEARAYCAWLSEQTGRTFRLATEVEWEAAARGLAGRRYAYGDTFDALRCNAFESHIRRTTPIGVFPGGETPQGLVDMTGNTWDWTSSLHRPYPYAAGDGRESPMTGDGRRVLCGGSWGLDPILARATCRCHDPPGLRSGGCGVRVVCASPMV